MAAFLKIDPPSRLVPKPPSVLWHLCTLIRVMILGLSAGDFSHVMALYLKKLDICGVSTNERFKEGYSMSTGRKCLQGFQDYDI
jgi:hypothetical protein